MLTRGGGILNETGLFPKVRLRESKKKKKGKRTPALDKNLRVNHVGARLAFSPKSGRASAWMHYLCQK